GGVAVGVAILGSTGSIGQSALAVLERHPDLFRVVALSAHSSGSLLREQVARYRPDLAVLVDAPPGETWSVGSPTRWAYGREALLEAVAHPDVRIVINAV